MNLPSRPESSESAATLDATLTMPGLFGGVVVPMGADIVAHYGEQIIAANFDGQPIRHILPEPLDIPDHIGNVGLSMPAGMVAGLGAAKAWIWCNNRLLHRQPSVKSTRAVAMTASFFVGTLMNYTNEFLMATPEHPPNYYDVAYGIGSAMLGSLFIRYKTTEQ